MPARSQRGRGASGASLRSPEAPSRSRPPEPPDRPQLRLAVSRGALGLELDAPFRLGPASVLELALSLPGVRFPVDLSGGVARFRHKRGELDRLVLGALAADVVAWGAPRLKGLFGEASPELVVAPIEVGALVGIVWGARAIAFEIVIAPSEGTLCFIPERARGIGLGAPAHVTAMRALAALAGSHGRVIGGALAIADAAGAVARSILPAAGARAPSTRGIRWASPVADGLRFELSARRDAPPPALDDRAIRAMELAELAGAADELSYAGDLEGARRTYLSLLERAPRHPELSRRVAGIDAAVGDRAEAALSTLIEAMPAIDAGLLGGELLAAVGDEEGAIAALTRGAEQEPFGPLAALCWLRAAELSRELDVRTMALDRAVQRAPGMERARWARLEARLDLGDVRGAKADAEHMEAAARGPEARHAVYRRVAEAFLARGFLAEASTLFERALRYAPEDADSVAGLARALRAAGQGRRALDLLARAAALAARKTEPSHAITVDLACGLAEIAGDRPAAVARVRTVPSGAPESFEARRLEARWRAELGDLAGAELALARMRDAIELLAPQTPDRAAELAAMLTEAATIEERERDDLLAAQRSLGLAMRLRPRDRAIAASFRRVAAEVARRAPGKAPRASSEEPEVPYARDLRDDASTQSLGDMHTGLTQHPISFEDAEPAEAPSEDDELLAARLTDRVRADPRDRASVLALADALARLGRDLELVALLSAQIDEGDEAARAELRPRRRATLERLAERSRREGRAMEAELYTSMAADDGQ